MKDIFSLILTLSAVAFVIYLSYLFSRYISTGSSKINSAKYMKVIDRLAVGQDRFILIVRVQSKVLLISATPQSVRVLKELQSDEFEDNPADEKKGLALNSFANVLQNIMKPKNNRGGQPYE